MFLYIDMYYYWQYGGFGMLKYSAFIKHPGVRDELPQTYFECISYSSENKGNPL